VFLAVQQSTNPEINDNAQPKHSAEVPMRRLKILLAAAVLLNLCLNCALIAQGVKSADTGPGAFLNISGAKIYYEECGNSPQTVVFLHDGVLHSAAWDDVWPELCKSFM